MSLIHRVIVLNNLVVHDNSVRCKLYKFSKILYSYTEESSSKAQAQYYVKHWDNLQMYKIGLSLAVPSTKVH